MSGLSRFKIGEGYKVMSGLAHLFFCSGQGLDLLEIRGWDDAALGVIKV